MNLKAIIEGILFVCGDEGISLDNLIKVLEKDENDIKEALSGLKKDYENEDRGIRISYLGNAFKLTTKSEYKDYFEKVLVDTKTYSLSEAAIETLAIIVYNEPITRMQIDNIRGVNSSGIVRKLLALGLIKECGKADSIGKPNLYKTTNEFLDYFGLASKNDLPKLEIFEDINEEKELYKSSYKEE